MQKPVKIDYTQLFGFDAVSDQFPDGVDFQADIFEAKLGAKVGAETLAALDIAACAGHLEPLERARTALASSKGDAAAL
jgi:hypothetical protein